MGDWNSTVPTFASGDEVPASKMTTETDLLTAITNAWTTWTPTLTNLTLGNGTVLSTYRRLGKTVDIRFRFVLGSTSAVGTNPAFSLPFSAAAALVTATEFPGAGMMADSSSGSAVAQPRPFISPATTCNLQYFSAATTVASITSTLPWTWAVGDSIDVWGTYYTD